MFAPLFSGYGAPDVLAEVDETHAGPGETPIAVRAAGQRNGADRTAAADRCGTRR